HDCLGPVQGEVQVIRGGDVVVGAGRPAGAGVDDRQRAAVHVVDVQLGEVPVRGDVLGVGAHREATHDLEGGRVDDHHVAGDLVGDVDPLGDAGQRGVDQAADGGGIHPASWRARGAGGGADGGHQARRRAGGALQARAGQGGWGGGGPAGAEHDAEQQHATQVPSVGDAVAAEVTACGRCGAE